MTMHAETPVAGPSWFPLTLEQEMTHLYAPNCLVPFFYRVSGALDVVALQDALRTVVDRHDALRMSLDADGVVRQAVSPPGSSVIDLGTRTVSDVGAFEAVEEEFHQDPIDLHHGGPVRALLVSAGPRSHALLVLVHHLALDAMSGAIFTDELWTSYEALLAGATPSLPSLDLSLRDHAEGQRSMGTSLTPEQRAYWAGAIKGGRPVQLARPARADASYEAGEAWHEQVHSVSESDVEDLKRLARAGRVPLLAASIAGVGMVASRLSGLSDFTVGYIVPGRDAPGTRHMIGNFARMSFLRLNVDWADSLGTYLQRASAAWGSAEANCKPPFSFLRMLMELAEAGLIDTESDPTLGAAVAINHVNTGARTSYDIVVEGREAACVHVEHRRPIRVATGGFFLLNLGLDQGRIELTSWYSSDVANVANVERLYSLLGAAFSELGRASIETPLKDILG